MHRTDDGIPPVSAMYLPPLDTQATLFSAEGRTDGSQLYYTLEYTVKGPRFYRHNVSVYTARCGGRCSWSSRSRMAHGARAQNRNVYGVRAWVARRPHAVVAQSLRARALAIGEAQHSTVCQTNI